MENSHCPECSTAYYDPDYDCCPICGAEIEPAEPDLADEFV